MFIDATNPPPDFVAWIKSINKSFAGMVYYKAFDDYIKEAFEWKDNPIFNEELQGIERKDAIKGEIERCRNNSLYYLETFNYYKEAKATDGSGRIKTYTCKAQQVICYLMDLGVSALIAKARGIRASSTILPVADIKCIVNKNMHIAFICSDKKKVEDLFESKLKFSHTNNPPFLNVNIGSDRKDGFEYFVRLEKGKKGGLNSKIIIHPPSKDVINGVNADINLVDEAASIPFFKAMLAQGRPALFTYDHETKKRIKSKQFIAWGSSQPDDGKTQYISEEFLDEWKKLEEQWNKGDFETGIVPIFFDYSAIPGMTLEEYEREKRIAESTGKDNDIKAFRNNYPSCVEDVLLTSIETLIPYERIAERLDNINLLIKNNKLILERGYFVPIYDKSKPLDPSIGSPFKIIGSDWYPVPDGSPVATATMFRRPDNKWINLYYQGTDPIESQAGQSNGSSSIWNNKDKDIDCTLAFRPVDYRHFFEQSYCMHLFYSNLDKNHFIPELLEINIGLGYLNYCEIMGFGMNMISRVELPVRFQVGNHMTGISKKSTNAPKILDETYNLMNTWGENIYIDDFWVEAKTYIKHYNKSNYGVRFAPSDGKYYRDDRIDSCTYAYIASLCYEGVSPQNIEAIEKELKKKKVLKIVNGQNKYVEVHE